MSTAEARRLAVLGHPIAHSKSPALHAAAYRVLGLNWSYDAVDLEADDLSGFVDSLDRTWRGLSLTMPHKQVVLGLVDELDSVAAAVGAANTLIFDDDGRRRGANTDVAGIRRALADHGVNRIDDIEVLGAGSTTRSLLAAAAAMGARRAVVRARDTAKAAHALGDLAERLGIALVVRSFEREDRSVRRPSLVASTLPGHVDPPLAFPEEVRSTVPFFDVAYDPWPTRLAAHWQQAGGTVVGGLDMLLHQALEQVRWFVTGDGEAALSREREVLAAMRESIAR